MGDESPIGKPFDPITQLSSKLVQLPKIGCLIGSVLCRMSLVYLNERFRDMPHHRRRILRVHPYMRIPSFVLSGSMKLAFTAWPVAKKRDAFRGGDDQE